MAKKSIISFTCPTCCNHSVYSNEQDVYNVSQVNENESFTCKECGEEFTAHVSNSGKSIKLIRRS